MAHFRNDRPQQAQSVNVGQFGPSHDSLQDWRSVFTAAAEVIRIKDNLVNLDSEMGTIKDEVNTTLTLAKEAVIVAQQINDDVHLEVSQAVTDIEAAEAEIANTSLEVAQNARTASTSAAEATTAQLRSEVILDLVKGLHEDIDNMKVELIMIDVGDSRAEFDTVTNTLTLYILNVAPDFAPQIGALPVNTDTKLEDFVVGFKEGTGGAKGTVWRFSLSEIFKHLTSGVLIRGEWDPTVNVNPTLAFGKSPPVKTGINPNGSAYIVSKDGEFNLTSTSVKDEFKADDIVQWISDDATIIDNPPGKWYHQKLSGTVVSVNGETGVVVLDAADIKALTGRGTELSEPVYTLKGTLNGSSNLSLLSSDTNKNMTFGDLGSTKTFISGSQVWINEKGVAPGRVYHEGFKPTVDLSGLDVYTKGQIDGYLSSVDTALDGKAPVPPTDNTGGYIWDSAGSGSWTSSDRSGIPVGTIMAFAAPDAPEAQGYLECAGQTITSDAYPAAVKFLRANFPQPGSLPDTSAKLPDLRGEFVRGWDHNKGTDPQRPFGTSQFAMAGTSATGAAPVNVALLYMMKVLESPVTVDQEVVGNLSAWLTNKAPLLEQKVSEVPTFYKSADAPTPAKGKDGDIWFQYTV